ncbi:MAG: hypothetical protein AUJ72_02530 [Candidatus Omnitrophica bacterium CG1_02_46_14]|nr:MAG: hypothetical protein AUJ72_02530 [Candidatus Omnitrophica bacterium CG1_02_46_14]
MKTALKAKKVSYWFLIKVLVVVLLIAGAFLMLKYRKGVLLKECTELLESSLSKGRDYRVHIGKVSGRLVGSLSFKDIVVEEPWLPADERTVFRADEVRFNYRWIDFFSKNANSKIEVVVVKPVIYCRPRMSLIQQEFPFFDWIRDWAIAQRNRFVIKLRSITVVMGYQKMEFKGIDIDYEDNLLRLEVPLTHFKLGNADVSSVIKIKGRFEAGDSITEDMITGQITTEGTVVNWNPMAKEVRLNFDISKHSFHVNTVELLGGLDVTGLVEIDNDFNMDFTLKAQHYLLANLSPILGLEKQVVSHGCIDTVTRLHGNVWAPIIESRWRIDEGWFEKKGFKAMDVTLEGVYPTVKIVDSRILLDDGSSMRIAEKTLEVREIFKEKTYETLVSEAQQETVVWGDWELSRQKDAQDQPEFMMQRNFGKNTNIHFTKYSIQDKPAEPRENKNMEVGFEYRLRAKDFLKLELRDDEEFVGVERKLKF